MDQTKRSSSANIISSDYGAALKEPTWFFQGGIICEKKSTGLFLWIHGKRTFLNHMTGLCPPVSAALLHGNLTYFLMHTRLNGTRCRSGRTQ